MTQALRYHLRRLVPATFVVVALALGIGFVSAVVALVYAVLFEPLPFADSERLVVLWERPLSGDVDFRIVSLPNFEDWRDRSQLFDGMACTFSWQPKYRIEHDRLRVYGSQVTEEFFEVMRAQPALGRLLGPGDFEPDAARAVVVSHRFWHRYLGSDPQAIGRAIELDGNAYSVVGVLQPILGATRFSKILKGTMRF